MAKQQKQSKQNKIRLFISYSRRDFGKIEKLYEALSGDDELDVYLDQHDIAAAEDWKQRLDGLIRSSDTILFAVSRDSVASDICQWEIDLATQLNKRIIPVIINDVADEDVPEEIARLNYVFARTDKELIPALASIGDALKIDIDWIREHTRLADMAHRWEQASKLGAQPLRGKELEAAEQWLSSQPKDAPPPTELQRKYIYESRKSATKRQRMTVMGSIAAMLIVGVLAGFAFVQRNAAIEGERKAEAALTRSNSAANDLIKNVSDRLQDLIIPSKIGVEIVEEIVAVQEMLAEDFVQDNELIESSARARISLGAYYLYASKTELAEKILEQAIPVLEHVRLTKSDPINVHSLAKAYKTRAYIARSNSKDPSKVVRLFAQSYVTFLELSEHFKDLKYHHDLIEILEQIEKLEKFHKLFEPEVTKNLLDVYRRELGNATNDSRNARRGRLMNELAAIYVQHDDRDVSLDFRSVISKYQRLSKDYPMDRFVLMELMDAFYTAYLIFSSEGGKSENSVFAEIYRKKWLELGSFLITQYEGWGTHSEDGFGNNRQFYAERARPLSKNWKSWKESSNEFSRKVSVNIQIDTLDSLAESSSLNLTPATMALVLELARESFSNALSLREIEYAKDVVSSFEKANTNFHSDPEQEKPIRYHTTRITAYDQFNGKLVKFSTPHVPLMLELSKKAQLSCDELEREQAFSANSEKFAVLTIEACGSTALQMAQYYAKLNPPDRKNLVVSALKRALHYSELAQTIIVQQRGEKIIMLPPPEKIRSYIESQ